MSFGETLNKAGTAPAAISKSLIFHGMESTVPDYSVLPLSEDHMNLAPTANELRAREIECRAKAKFPKDLSLATKYLEKAEWYAKAATEPLEPQLSQLN